MTEHFPPPPASPRVVVTGASRGIGKSIAERLQREGWSVVNVDIMEPDSESAGEWIHADLADPVSTREAMSQVLTAGGVSGLVNNAAIPGDMDLLSGQTDADMDRVYAINVRAPEICAQALSDSMRAQGYGRIVNLSSRAYLGKAHRTAYGGSKGAIASMTKIWAIELAEFGITCNAVAPGPVRTEMFEAANPPSMPRTQKIIDAIPVKRIGETEDIAHAVAFFMDRRSGYVTGQILVACGGAMLTRGGS